MKVHRDNSRKITIQNENRSIWRYLRQLGALDERDPKNLRVLVANYMSGPNNCLASSGFYSVCCINECEAVLSEVERRIAAPTAAPETLARVMVDVPSPTVKVPR